MREPKRGFYVPAEPADIEATILRLLADTAEGKTISPTDVALVFEPGANWHLLMPPVRRAAVKLAMEGRIVIYRKGKPADPQDFKGVYRLGLPRHD
jgi:hypothetical protein